MDLFVLDDLIRRSEIIDQYESLIWTDRYSEHGEFQLNIRASRGMRNLLTPGRLLAINGSDRVMQVETIDDKVNDDGQAELEVSGSSLEKIMKNRANQNIGTIGAAEKLVMTGTPPQVAQALFNRMCISNYSWPEDNLEFFKVGIISPPGNIPMSEEVLTFIFDPESLYDSVKAVCDTYNLGFRIVRNGDTSELYFEVYTGSDRTPIQDVLDPVIFSPELDNLSNTHALTSTEGHKNVAYVFNETDNLVVYEDAQAEVLKPDGFQRKVLVVDASDVDLPVGPELTAALRQKGLEELAKQRPVVAFDGELSQYVGLEYMKHYGLGDLVQVRNQSGMATNMRVVEHIYISDKQGLRSYPTTMIDKLITPGSWDAWDATQVWDDVSAYWANV